MAERKILLTDYLSAAQNAVSCLRIEGYSFIDEDMVWQILIYEFDYSDIPTEVLFHKFNSNDIFQIISAYFKKYGPPIAAIIDNDIAFPEDITELEKANIKYGGEIWTIHKNDADPFPSSPHAHNYPRHLKLHLGTGDLYRKTALYDTLPKKDLLAIRNKISQQLPGLILP